MTSAGYSGTPLAKKLGIKPGHTVALVRAPEELRTLLAPLPGDVEIVADEIEGADIVLAFSTRRSEIEADLPALAAAIFPDRSLWLAWPKKSSNVASDLTGDVVRGAVLATDHLVDVKVCAISEVWSGLKIMWRKDHR
jgi:hypothetical protein